MHKVYNNGSALQAFALQKTIETIGHSAKLIDYDFNANKRIKTKPIKKIVDWIIQLLLGFPKYRRVEKFNKFHKEYFNLTELSYDNMDSLQENPPIFDVYCTGSDQVWNPRFISNDTSFMLSFAPEEKPRLSFAASFATNEIPDNLKELYKKHLVKYNQICVREQSNVGIIKELTEKDSTVVCDPTILMTADEWISALKLKPQKREKNYILVYVLAYMYNPYPYINNIIEYVKSTLGYQVVFLGGKISNSFNPNTSCIRDEGPTDFVNLIRNASFMVTDSFHGTAFSAIFGIPMLGVVKSKNSKDGRLITLLDKIGGSHSIVEYTENISYSKEELLNLKCDKSLLDKYREFSLNTLNRMLNQFTIK